ncbi:regulatory protein, LuxR [Aurantiacibacter atlanticus]|uniref:Regulatory protein, LuxR n=1 Tax=Aurantiacibacter atlanticus TaxID=1648404 RepID=A0A0H4VEL7_9SPHN|nr:helix-turn-helix transcriptional regulator [Aurantiacibacter atlanticus]AKQ43142.2 regulatory protein, LuxR [Aurantiacibacter atlanticus]MDF1833831.1 helix-turn-helix transcriptional regulator [Alteraurantiacibacter sp. bin_em_oilr2.035]
MRVPNLGETDLLVPLHEGMFEEPMWYTFLSRLRHVAGADCAAIVLRTAQGNEMVRLASAGGDWPHGLDALFTQSPDGENAVRQAMREGRVYSRSELAQEAPLAGLAADSDVPALRAMRLGIDRGIDAVLLLAGTNPLGPDIASLMSAIAPHFKVALRVLGAMERERVHSEMSAQAFARINFGWISLNDKCGIVDVDPQAGRLLQQSGALRRGTYDRLTPADAAVDRQLTALVREFAANPKARPRAINLSHDPWIDILVAPLRIRALSGGSDAVAVVYIRGDRSSSADRAEQLVDLFDLTPSEARLAWSMAQGLSIAEAAQEHGLTIETARNYSKKIYGKTGARGQVDLVRHVLTGVLALA